MTRRRIQRLERYMEANVLNDHKFICRHYDECLASTKGRGRFHEGQLSHVGHRYDLVRNGKPFRIVVVGQEYAARTGAGRLMRPGVSLDERYSMIRDGSGADARYYADSQHPPRNPHMRGTTSALRILFGGEPGSDYEGEWVSPERGRPFHMFDGFALVNILLCSALDAKNNGASTAVMRGNCLEHFRASLEILQPTILVLQGVGVRRWITPVLEEVRSLRGGLEEALVAGGRTIVCALSHPAAHGSVRWGDNLEAPYLVSTVEPKLREVLRRAG
ncbi:MAG: hypothetical protein WEE66_02470 [Actinomycetota bacterium]